MVVAVEPGSVLDAAQEAMRLADRDPARAIDAATRVVREATRARDLTASALAEQALGHSLLQCAEVDAAIRHLRRAANYAEEARSWTVAGQAKMKLAYAMVQRGPLTAALREIDAAVNVLRGHSGAVARA